MMIKTENLTSLGLLYQEQISSLKKEYKEKKVFWIQNLGKNLFYFFPDMGKEIKNTCVSLAKLVDFVVKRIRNWTPACTTEIQKRLWQTFIAHPIRLLFLPLKIIYEPAYGQVILKIDNHYRKSKKTFFLKEENFKLNEIFIWKENFDEEIKQIEEAEIWGKTELQNRILLEQSRSIFPLIQGSNQERKELYQIFHHSSQEKIINFFLSLDFDQKKAEKFKEICMKGSDEEKKALFVRTSFFLLQKKFQEKECPEKEAKNFSFKALFAFDINYFAIFNDEMEKLGFQKNNPFPMHFFGKNIHIEKENPYIEFIMKNYLPEKNGENFLFTQTNYFPKKETQTTFYFRIYLKEDFQKHVVVIVEDSLNKNEQQIPLNWPVSSFKGLRDD